METIHNTILEGWEFTDTCDSCMSKVRGRADDIQARRYQKPNRWLPLFYYFWNCPACNYSTSISMKHMPDHVIKAAEERAPSIPATPTLWERFKAWFNMDC